jgi:hypothetical protein
MGMHTARRVVERVTEAGLFVVTVMRGKVTAFLDGKREGAGLPLPLESPVSGPDGTRYTHTLGCVAMRADEVDAVKAAVSEYATSSRVRRERREALTKALEDTVKTAVGAYATSPQGRRERREALTQVPDNVGRAPLPGSAASRREAAAPKRFRHVLRLDAPVQALLDAAGATKLGLAETIGVGRRSIQDAAQNGDRVLLETLRRYASALGGELELVFVLRPEQERET